MQNNGLISIKEAEKKYGISRSTFCDRARFKGIKGLIINGKLHLPEALAKKPVRKNSVRGKAVLRQDRTTTTSLLALAIITKGLKNADFSNHYGFGSAEAVTKLTQLLPSGNGAYK